MKRKIGDTYRPIETSRSAEWDKMSRRYHRKTEVMAALGCLVALFVTIPFLLLLFL